MVKQEIIDEQKKSSNVSNQNAFSEKYELKKILITTKYYDTIATSHDWQNHINLLSKI